MSGRAQPAPASASSNAAIGNGNLRRRHLLRWGLVVAVVLLVAAEIAARSYGFQNPLLYTTTEYGYRVAPGQDFRRLGNHVRYNAFGMRNREIAPLPAPGVLRILCLGDSVTNGGAIIDQQQTLSAELERLLGERFGAVEVLNASAPGWAVANETGWLRANGVFGSQYVLLILSSHDLFQPLAPSSIVDSYPEFPSSKPVLALQNIVHRYVLPRLLPSLHTSDPGADGVVSSEEQSVRIRHDVQSMARDLAGRAHMVVVFIEQEEDRSSDSQMRGARRSMFSMLAEEGIPIITLSDQIERLGRNAIFRDNVHPSADGNRIIAEAIARRFDDIHLRLPAVLPGEGGVSR